MGKWFRNFFSEDYLVTRGIDLNSRLTILDAGRALAAIAVLFWHYQHFFVPIGGRMPRAGFENDLPARNFFAVFYSNGHLAVSIFWLLSGFVFSSVYLTRLASTREFATNRFARLYPLHFLTLMLVLVLQLVAMVRFKCSLVFGNSDAKHFVSQLFLASNWFDDASSFNAPIWSVSVEVLIYVAFWICHRRLLRFGIVGPMTVCGLFFAILMFVPANKIAQCGFYFFFGSTLWAFWVGSAAYYRSLLASAVIGIVIGGLAFRFGSFQVWRAVGIPAFFGGVILIMATAERGISPTWGRRLVAIGDNTYGMYLWHVPVQLAIFLCMPAGFDVAKMAQSWIFLALFITGVAVVARFGFVIWERPMRDRLRRWGTPHSAEVINTPRQIGGDVQKE